MKKRTLMLATAATLALVMTACGTTPTSNDPTSTAESTKEAVATTAPTTTNTPAAEPTAEPTVEPVATDAPTPEVTATPESTATSTPTPAPTATPVPTATPSEDNNTSASLNSVRPNTGDNLISSVTVTSAPTPTKAPVEAGKYVVTYEVETLNRETYEYEYPEVTKAFDTFSELTDFIEYLTSDEYREENRDEYIDVHTVVSLVESIDEALVSLSEVELNLDEETRNVYIESGVFDDYVGETENGTLIQISDTKFAGKSLLIMTERMTGEEYVYAEKYHSDAGDYGIYDELYSVGDFDYLFE